MRCLDTDLPDILLTVAADLSKAILLGLVTRTVAVTVIPMEEGLDNLSWDTILSDHIDTDFQSAKILKGRNFVITNNITELLYQSTSRHHLILILRALKIV